MQYVASFTNENVMYIIGSTQKNLCVLQIIIIFKIYPAEHAHTNKALLCICTH